jgi:hypothetical protein
VKLFLHYGDLCDATCLITIITQIKPNEIYNLGAMSHVQVSDYGIADIEIWFVWVLISFASAAVPVGEL